MLLTPSKPLLLKFSRSNECKARNVAALYGTGAPHAQTVSAGLCPLPRSGLPAHADTLTISTENSGVHPTPLSIQGFNPALGTLTSVTTTLGGQYQVSNLGSSGGFNEFDAYLYSGDGSTASSDVAQIEFFNGTYNYSDPPFTNSYDDSFFTNAGLVQYNLYRQ